MAFVPGSYVMYDQTDHRSRPPWPAVVCSDDMVPKTVRRAPVRENGEIAILLLQKHEVRVVFQGYLRKPDHNFSKELANRHPGLEEAHRQMIDAIADGLSLRHWKAVTKARYQENEGPDYSDSDSDTDRGIRMSSKTQFKGKGPAPLMTEAEDDAEDDDLQRALEASLVGLPNGKRPSSFEAGESSRSRPPKKQRTTPGVPSSPLSIRGHTASSVSDHAPLGHKATMEVDSNETADNHHRSSDNEMEDEDETIPNSSSGRFNAMSVSTPPSEAEENDDSLDIWIIGPDSKKFFIPKSAFDSREHLSKINALDVDDNGKRIVTKPVWREIDPDKFELIIPFLASGDFQLPTHGPDREELDEEGRKSAAMEHFTSAWEVASDIDLDDLMAMIVSKFRDLQPWPLPETLDFARTVYKTPFYPGPETEMEVVRDMRDLVSSYIADNERDLVSSYIADNEMYQSEAYESILHARFREVPELGRDYYAKVVEKRRKEFEE